ncbi:DNA-directed RNA polymerase II subunit GRINL1A [Osmia bicornis bicornis]|uniref:DNA-directed RNA polymerase II subunit GRINL1A n=1 Tax=Osmia bicornis bicornis TaxID=1437191 RepID=UPI001EAE8A4E|nr:DNA-directed RNA polymerase II subunit GRINL1A [Osmia bicornis bicornis]XP_029040742.2 DNA-directed RNA polymerase II subunit GRINL1A [Osmia bicornis bicornis]
MYKSTVLHKIPGDLPPIPKQEHQGYIDDMGKLKKFQLEEILERQNKILNNKAFILKLPDKGEKIKKFRDRLVEELKNKDDIENAANLLSGLNIASEGKMAMNKLEWTGKYNETKNTEKIVQLDSDDEDDPLKILAQPTGSGVHKKKVIHLPPEESLIKPEDLAEIESFKKESTEPADHVSFIVNKVENHSEDKNKKIPFKPYKTTKSGVHEPEKEKQRKQNKYWEVTAATPPLIVHDAAKIIDLSESLRLQKEQSDKLQEIQAKHAAERLAEQFGLHSIGPVPQNVGTYREPSEKDSGSESEEHEVHDDEDNDKRGTVVFTVDSIEH